MPARPTHSFTYSVVTPLFLGDALRDRSPGVCAHPAPDCLEALHAG